MGRYAQLVIGPAGSGKSTYCDNLRQHCETVGRSVHVVNLDPAADVFHYPVAFDIRDLISLEDVMEELKLGPNGGLLYCMEYLEESLEDWLGEQLQGYGEDDYLVFDCPGQIELYSHISVFRSFVDFLKRDGWSVAAVYCTDCQFVGDPTKFIAGSLQAMAAMVQLELPHMNLLTKVDLLGDENKAALDNFLFPEASSLAAELDRSTSPGFRRLNAAVAQLVDEWSMVAFAALDYSDEESIGDVLAQIDHCIQWGEDADVKIRDLDMGEMGGENI
ncbi:hypothetical protein COCSUDRAFT_28525 [Coccomyxa subellipsoidea C-169]|uniref:GPN-loop GTPase 3 n=1 Tax=Coccomyxa subellipsoidea (strain C-169) TaxID=574566 RepID=I0YZV8_COCSC|nr:hypothetical protein COCSUDRAFT_28525 [Coccomyxa subellipsoidea C-169]EIE23927.1 hypothetical protein COCSUDRAFT_28525 [Coccomyxa subellipsoidea C-169]|eukprot:XP_005648471.1 hypothetical protein COCSUDRAFT_28525 [Coccomyxa subellipsoidea C-169]